MEQGYDSLALPVEIRKTESIYWDCPQRLWACKEPDQMGVPLQGSVSMDREDLESRNGSAHPMLGERTQSTCTTLSNPRETNVHLQSHSNLWARRHGGGHAASGTAQI